MIWAQLFKSFIVSKRTGKGSDEHISLNPKKVSEIREFLEKIE